MPFAIRTSRLSLPTRTRTLIERYLRLALGREPFRLSAVVLYLRPARISGTDVEWAGRLVIRSPQFRQITVRDADTKLSRLLVRLVRRARYVGRRRHERTSRFSRPSGDRLTLRTL